MELSLYEAQKKIEQRLDSLNQKQVGRKLIINHYEEFKCGFLFTFSSEDGKIPIGANQCFVSKKDSKSYLYFHVNPIHFYKLYGRFWTEEDKNNFDICSDFSKYSKGEQTLAKWEILEDC
jgi:hypothetical protein